MIHSRKLKMKMEMLCTYSESSRLDRFMIVRNVTLKRLPGRLNLFVVIFTYMHIFDELHEKLATIAKQLL